MPAPARSLLVLPDAVYRSIPGVAQPHKRPRKRCLNASSSVAAWPGPHARSLDRDRPLMVAGAERGGKRRALDKGGHMHVPAGRGARAGSTPPPWRACQHVSLDGGCLQNTRWSTVVQGVRALALEDASERRSGRRSTSRNHAMSGKQKNIKKGMPMHAPNVLGPGVGDRRRGGAPAWNAVDWSVRRAAFHRTTVVRRIPRRPSRHGGDMRVRTRDAACGCEGGCRSPRDAGMRM